MNAADRIRDCLRQSDKIARLGGDEFIIILPNIISAAASEIVASKVLDAFVEGFTFEGLSSAIGVSIGISVCPEHSEDAETLLAKADAAMYISKNNGRNCYTMHDARIKPTLEIV